MRSFPWVLGLALVAMGPTPTRSADLKLSWADEYLSVRGAKLPGGSVRIMYLEAFCRAGSTDRDWKETVIPHKSTLIEASADGSRIRLRNVLDDGVVVDHVITATDDEVDFRLTARNPTETESMAHWAQPCVRVDAFTGVKAERNSEAYLSRSFVYLDGRRAYLPTTPWAKKARYIPGQVWCPAAVDRNDVNPRPLSPLVPSNGLVGCTSADGKMTLASAWEPYQELFQGVATCLHSDLRIGGLKPGEVKSIRGKLYLVSQNEEALLRRYEQDFPEHKLSGQRP